MLVFCCVGTGLLYLPPLLAHSPVQLVLFVALSGLLTGGIVTASNSLVGLSVPLNRQGAAYGLSQSANSLGGGLGPLLGGEHRTVHRTAVGICRGRRPVRGGGRLRHGGAGAAGPAVITWLTVAKEVPQWD